MTRLQSEGKCIFCNETFSDKGIGRHLTTHLKKMEKEQPSSNQAFHLKVSAGEMFLHLLVDGNTKFREIDGFLRAIWLECCGHLSSFQIKKKRYNIRWGGGGDFGEKMSSKISTVLEKGMQIDYRYDFGSTTPLDIKVVNVYSLKVKKGVTLLSRNEPLPILCDICKQEPAVVICSICIYEEASMFCEDCAKKHEQTCPDFEDYAASDVVNSPRMGVCGYEGGTIDTERDGVWKK
ncbi:MAG TPA: hypothetical protein ENJ53_08630 [Phaeodactylibacter sp.]|nr:hypothetical protein [Phaeodactylibacter sp.]